MATKKGPQIYLNDQDPAELEIFDWSETLGRGRKSLATIEAIIAGRAIARVCQPIADLLVSAARRGESVSLEQLEDYISMFKAHNKGEVKPYPSPAKQEAQDPPQKPVKAKTPQVEEQLEIDESPRERTGLDDLGA